MKGAESAKARGLGGAEGRGIKLREGIEMQNVRSHCVEKMVAQRI